MAKDLADIAPVIEQMLQIKENIVLLEDRFDVLKAMVIEELAGDNEGFIDGKPVVTYTQATSRNFDMTWLKTNMPDIYEQGRKEKTTTRFSLVQETRNGS
jgi:predicted phage-related endonuclease